MRSIGNAKPRVSTILTQIWWEGGCIYRYNTGPNFASTINIYQLYASIMAPDVAWIAAMIELIVYLTPPSASSPCPSQAWSSPSASSSSSPASPPRPHLLHPARTPSDPAPTASSKTCAPSTGQAATSFGSG